MKFIVKEKTAPQAFIDIVHPVISGDVNTGYNSLGTLRKELIKFLIHEQRGLCAYCNQLINEENSTVEHLICQSHNPSYDLNYYNLFAVCNGNEGKIPTSHCDKFRANGSGNGYFFPFILFDKCVTNSWAKTNPFFDIEFNRKLSLVTGRIVPKEMKVDGFPRIKENIQHVIDTLNLNAPILITARKRKWEMVLDTREKENKSWEELVDYYLNHNTPVDFIEFVLLAIRKQVLN